MRLLLIDGNSVGFYAFNANKLSAAGVETQGVFNSLNAVRTLINVKERVIPIVFWDGSSWRKQAHPEYKAQRDDNPKIADMRERYKKQRPLIVKSFNTLGIRQVQAGNMEADDLIALTVHNLPESVAATIISGDKDLLQLVRPKVDWLDLFKGRSVTSQTFTEETGFSTPLAFVEGKALIGDLGDNLKGVEGIGQKRAEALLAEFGSVQAFFEAFWSKGEDAIPACMSSFKKKLMTFAGDGVEQSEGLKIYHRNMHLMHLVKDNIPPIEDRKDIPGRFNLDKFHAICAELQFHSIMRKFDEWVEPFERCAEKKRA